MNKSEFLGTHGTLRTFVQGGANDRSQPIAVLHGSPQHDAKHRHEGRGSSSGAQVTDGKQSPPESTCRALQAPSVAGPGRFAHGFLIHSGSARSTTLFRAIGMGVQAPPTGPSRRA